ncbi:YjzD family protein [Brochothrix campestris]
MLIYDKLEETQEMKVGGVSMRYVVSALWIFILSAMTNYVVSSMASATFNMGATLLMGTIVTLAVWFLPLMLKSHEELSN